MGFWDSAEKLANGLNKKAEEYMGEVERQMERFDRYPDEKLIEKYKRCTNNKEKIALTKILESRGYKRRNNNG